MEWDSTTLVLVHAFAGDEIGLGYTYGNRATALLIHEFFAKIVEGGNAMAVRANWEAMVSHARNLGRPGIVSMAISAVDSALWDLKARLLGLPLVTLLGPVREGIPIYGSGGFTSYTNEQLEKQLGGWVAAGIPRLKMKIGRDAYADRERVRLARAAIGYDTALFVDANGAYTRKQALAQAEVFSHSGVVWFEEPVSSDDLEGLRLIRDRAPATMEIAAGEYGYRIDYFHMMIEAGAVDVLQADATRCGGITGFLDAAALCTAHHLSLSAPGELLTWEGCHCLFDILFRFRHDDSPDMYTGWGVRTLSADHPAYDPYSYHRGSVWPVEHGTFAVGMMRFGLIQELHTIARGIFEVSSLFDYHRLPECFSGHPRDAAHPFPALYPKTNWPQAWSASSLFSIMQAILGIYPYAPMRLLLLDPRLPEWLPEITMRNLHVGSATVAIRFYRKGPRTHFDILDKRGKLHVLRQPSPWSLSSTFGERLKDVMESLIP